MQRLRALLQTAQRKWPNHTLKKKHALNARWSSGRTAFIDLREGRDWGRKAGFPCQAEPVGRFAFYFS